jgi:diaminohydroxyphosphoribosylaminopyrimidine deaminase/5-amino-6-(5-phosphoribosylamino)uracil reductase
MDDAHFMRRALALAAEGWGQTAPNPMVGAVVVRDGEIVGEGYHARYGEAHAEPRALAAAGDRARGATLYVTLEPCTHHGHTPPCVDAIVAAGIARVVVAIRDPNPVAAGGVDGLQAAGIEVVLGVFEHDARELNAPFFHSFGSDLPWVTIKLALSIDGAIAPSSGGPVWLTGPESRRMTHRMRAGSDAIAVGVHTVLIDDPLLTVRDAPAPRVPPTRVVFDRNARTPVTSALLQSIGEAPVIIARTETGATDATRSVTMEKALAQVVGGPDLRTVLTVLARMGIRSLLVEGGAILASAFIEAGLAHRLVTFQAPVVLGAGARNAFAHLSPRRAAELGRLPVLDRRALGDDLMTVYAIDREPTGVHRAD